MKFYLLLFFVLSYSILLSQSKLDLDEYNPNKEYLQKYIDSLCLDYASGTNKYFVRLSRLKKVLLTNSNLDGWMYYYGGMSSIVHREKKLDSALFYVNKGIEHYYNFGRKRSVNEYMLMRLYYNKGEFLHELNDYAGALENYQMAMELSKKYKPKWIGYLMTGLADLHYDIGNDEKAIEYFNLAIKDSLYINIPRAAIALYSRIGKVYKRQENFEAAKETYIKGVNYCLRSSEGKRGLFSLYGNLGIVYFNNNKDSAGYYFRKAIRLENEPHWFNSDKIFENDKLLYKSFLKLFSGFDQEASGYLIQIINNLKQYKVIDKEDRESLELIKEIAYSMDNKSSNEILKNADNLLKNSYDSQFKENIENIEIIYQSKQKDDSIAQLEETTKNQQLILQQQKTINWVLGGLLLSLVGIGFLFIKQRNQKEKYKTANLEQRLLRSQLNPHFLFNALNTASSLAHKQSKETTSYISKLGSLLRSVLENSREEFISIEEEVETLHSYLILQSDFSKKFKYTIQVQDDIDTKEVLIPPMFIQPFLENAIQYGFKGAVNEEIKIVIRATEEDKTLHIEIQNNGFAYSKTVKQSTSDEHNSLSGKILKERLAIYAKSYKTKSYYTIKDVVDGVSGTKVALYLPLVKDV